MSGAVEVRGYREVVSALGKVSSDSRKVLAAALREAAWPVQADTRSRLAKYEGIDVGISVRARGVSVEERRGRTTGLRPDFGVLQMTKGFIPALDANTEETYKGVELAFDALIREAGF